MLDLPLYARLFRARSILTSRAKRELSFGDLINELLANRMDLLDLDQRLKHYIGRFAEALRTVEDVQGAILFGSVAKEDFSENSDIDILVLLGDSSTGMISKISEIVNSMRIEAMGLMSAGLPSLISPMFLTLKEVESIRPIFFDIVDYGICLFDKNGHVSDFRFAVNRVKHDREMINNLEVLTWQ